MRWARIVGAWLVAAIAMAASVTGLWHMAEVKAEMTYLAAGAVVAGFDVTAVLAGLRVAERPKEFGAWALLITLATASAACQILAAPEHLGWWRLAHGIPPVAAIWTLHGAVKDAPTKSKKKTPKKQDRAARNGAGAASGPAAPPLPPAEEAQGSEIGMAPVADLGARRKGRHRATETGAAPLSPEDARRVQEAAMLLLGEGARKATRRDIERVLSVGNRVAGRLLPAVNEAMAEGPTMTAGADND